MSRGLRLASFAEHIVTLRTWSMFGSLLAHVRSEPGETILE
jgi:hypothetical protein